MAQILGKVFFFAAHVFASVSANCNAVERDCKVDAPNDAVSLLQMPLQVDGDDVDGEEVEEDFQADNMDDAMEVGTSEHKQNENETLYCKQTREGTNNAPICPGQRMLQQDCGFLQDLNRPKHARKSPKDRDYQFMESTATCATCHDEHGHFTYIPATRCYKKDSLEDDNGCSTKSKTITYFDLWKYYPELVPPTLKGHGTISSPLGSPSLAVGTIHNFKPFGSKVTADGKFIFLADADRDLIIALDLTTSPVKIVAKFDGPNIKANDIAILDNGGSKDITLYACGVKGKFTRAKNILDYFKTLDGVIFSKNTAWHTGVHVATVRKDNKWVTDSEKNSCGIKARDGQQGAGVAGGCKIKKITGYQFATGKNFHTCAGIGLTGIPKGGKQPNLWLATLQGFAFIDMNKGKHHWDLEDQSWHGSFDCTLPKAYANRAGYRKRRGIDTWKKSFRFGLVDNVVMVDKNTMITAIYTDCDKGSGVSCLGFDYMKIGDHGDYGMYDKDNIHFNALTFTATCINKVTDTMLEDKDLSGASKTYVYPLPDWQCGGQNCPFYNGRITHIQSVGDSLVAINYQFDKIMTFPGTVTRLRCACAETDEERLEANCAEDRLDAERLAARLEERLEEKS